VKSEVCSDAFWPSCSWYAGRSEDAWGTWYGPRATILRSKAKVTFTATIILLLVASSRSLDHALAFSAGETCARGSYLNRAAPMKSSSSKCDLLGPTAINKVDLAQVAPSALWVQFLKLAGRCMETHAT
jgi:hypothetical protein